MSQWLRTLCLACSAVLTVAAAAQAQSIYQISVELDESTTADGDLLTAAAVTAPAGDASQSIRKLAAGFVGEVHILLNRRIDRDGMLTLDDMNVVALAEEDVIEVKKVDCKVDCGGGGGGVTVIVLRNKTGTGRPASIRFNLPNGCRQLLFADQGKPTFMPCQAIPVPASPK